MTIPDYVLLNSKTYTARKFKSSKRKQLRELKKALSNLQTGCAYLPSGSDEVDIISRSVDRIQRDISIKNWGN